MRVVIIGLTAVGVWRFRASLTREMVRGGHAVLVMAPDDDPQVRSDFAAMGARYEPIALDRNGLNPFQDLRTLLDLRRVFRRERADVVLAFGAKPVGYGLLAARSLGVPIRAANITGAGTAFIPGEGWRLALIHWTLRLLYRASLRFARVVFFQNRDDARLFRDLKLVSESSRVVLLNGSGVDLDEFAPVALPGGPTTFVMMCRVIGIKGVLEFVEAARIINATHPEAARFLLVGPLDTNPTAISLGDLQRWAAAGIIEYRDAVADVRPVIAEGHVAVLPSYGGEGVPRFLLEAMAMGRAVVTTDVPGCRDTVDGANGFIVPPRDVTALADVMTHLIEHRSSLEEMGRASRAMAVGRFDVHQVDRQIMEALSLGMSEGVAAP